MKTPAWWILAASAGLATTANAEQTGLARRILAADDSTHRLAIVAPDGSLEWEVKVGAIHDACVLPNGNIFFQQGWQKLIEVAPDKKVVWTFRDFKNFGNSMPAQAVLETK